MTLVAARRRAHAVGPELVLDQRTRIIPFPAAAPVKSARQLAHEAREREQREAKAFSAIRDRLVILSDEELAAEVARVCGNTPWEAMSNEQKETHLEQLNRASRREWAGREPFQVVQEVTSAIERRLAAHVMSRAMALLRMTPEQLVARHSPVLRPCGQWMTAAEVRRALAGERFPEHLVVHRLRMELLRHCERRYGRRIRPGECDGFARPRPPRYERRLLAGLFRLTVLAMGYAAMLVSADTDSGRLNYNDVNGPLSDRIAALTTLFPEVI